MIVTGDTYALAPDVPRKEALEYWFRSDTHTYVAEQCQHSVGETVGFLRTLTASPIGRDRQVVGTYILRPNQAGAGSHVANAAFMVAPNTRGQGIGRTMGEHSLNEARRLGFRAMQFNFVVSTNKSAIHLWEQLGFEIVGTLPGAFRHPEKGYVDVYVMFRSLL